MIHLYTYYGDVDAKFEEMNQSASMDGVQLRRWEKKRRLVRLRQFWYRARPGVMSLGGELPDFILRIMTALRPHWDKGKAAVRRRRLLLEEYDGSWKSGRDIDGYFRIRPDSIVLTVGRNRKCLSDKQISTILDRLAGNWMMRPLDELEKSYERLRRRLQRTESSREVYVAIWKSSPYITISLVTALVTSYLYFEIDRPVGLVGGIAGLGLVLAVGVTAWLESRKRDSYVASLRILSDRVGSLLGERVALMAADLRRLKDKLPMVDIPMRGRPFHDLVNQVRSKHGPLEGHIKSDRMRDVKSRYPALAEGIVELYEVRDYFVAQAADFRHLATKKTERILDTEHGSEGPEYLLLALFLVCSGKMPNAAALLLEAPNKSGESPYLERLLSDDRVYREIAEDPSLVEAASRAADALEQAALLRLDVITSIEYHFGRP